MSDLTDDDLSALERDADHLPSSPITLGEIQPLLDEVSRHRATIKRMEELALSLEHNHHPDMRKVGADLRARLKGARR